MASRPITSRSIDAATRLVDRGDKPSVTLRDGRVPGLALVIGKRTARWSFEYKSPLPDGGWSPGKRLPLGDLSEVSVDAAREAGVLAKRQIAEGLDPLGARRARRRNNREASASRTVGDAIERFIAERSPDWTQSTRVHFRADFELIRAALGDAPMALVERHELVEFIGGFIAGQQAAGASGVCRAVRLAQNISALWRQAAAGSARFAGWNWSGVDPAVAAGLPVPGKHRLTARRRFLDVAEITTVWPVLRDGVPGLGVGRAPRVALQLALITGLRLGAISLCRVEDLHLDPPVIVGELDSGPWIRIPAEEGRKFDARSRREGADLVLPLSRLAARLFSEALMLRKDSSSPFVFVGQRGMSLSPGSVSRAWTRLAAVGAVPSDTRAHDLRRSMRSHLGDLAHGGDWLDEERLLGHAPGRKVARTYDRGRRLARLRPLADAWATRLEQIVSGPKAEVVVLQGEQ